jgi:hypothetical protein
MGLFGSREELSVSEPGVVEIPAYVAEQVTDVGTYFIGWATAGIHEEQAQWVVAAVEAKRGQNGWIPINSLSEIGIMDFRSGPLTFLAGMTAADRILMEVWASFGLGGKDKRYVSGQVSALVYEQGHAAAATWALASRPNARLDLGLLNDQLVASWQKGSGYVRNKDFIKAFRKWER